MFEALEPAQERQRLARRQAADFGRAGAGREGRVEAVDVEGDVDRAVTDQLPRLGDDVVACRDA